MQRNDQTDTEKLFETGGKQPWNRSKSLVIGIVAVVLVCALGLFAPALLEMLQSGDLDAPSAGDTLEQNAPAQVPDISISDTALSIELTMSRYTKLLSSVPGMPIRAICPGADEIRFVTDAGTLLEYGAPDYTVKEHGSELNCTSGETAYLSPAAEDNTDTYRITVSALSSGSVIGNAVIILSHTDGELTIENMSVSSYAQ